MALEPEDPEVEQSGLWDSLTGRVPVLVLAALIMLSLAAICALGYMLIRGAGNDEGDPESVLAPTPFTTPIGAQPVAAGGADAIVYGISDSSTVSVTLEIPVTLSLAGREYSVTRQTINPDGSWSPGVDGEATAGWVYGSVVNYILALEPSAENQTAFDSMGPGTQMIMTTEDGSDFVYEFAQRDIVATNDPNIFAQTTPGITLIILESGEDQRQVITGRYLITESSAASGASPVIDVGEAAQLNDLTISVSSATYVPTHTDAPPGFAFFLIDFQIINNGAATIDVNSLRLVLVDDVGNQYALNPVASQLGQQSPLTGGFLSPGQSVQATVGYQVPSGLVSQSLTWTVIRTDTGEQVQVNIPFLGDNVAESTTITLQSVEVSADLNSMLLVGQISNSGEQTVVVVPEDVTLKTPDGASYLMLSTNPAFPWTVPPGQTLLYSVTFQTPLNAQTAVFTVLHQPFELTNLSS